MLLFPLSSPFHLGGAFWVSDMNGPAASGRGSTLWLAFRDAAEG